MKLKAAGARLKMAGGDIFLRPPARRDEAEFLALMRASARLHKGFVASPKQPNEFAKFLKQSNRRNSVWLFVCLKEDASIVGAFHLDQIIFGNFRSAYMGYYVGAPYAGRGYMSVGIRLVLRHAFEGLKLHRVEANIQPDNAPSIALVRRAGFKREGYSPRYLKVGGRWRDHERWAITREDWKAWKKGEGRGTKVRDEG
jgi:[ribosomal protein S5]-alanine N-acetyltransferase